MASNGASCSGADQSSAWVFKANYLDNGTLYFTTQNGTLYLTLDINNFNIYAGTELVNAATWGIRAVELNNTAVEEIECEDGDVRVEIYDLAGRKVENPTKGMYIVDGKKVFIK
jgi:hypothetical protein